MLRTLAIAAALALATPAFAQDIASFIVAGDEGYGVDVCLQSADSCGEAVARGWCVANGYDRAIGYRRAVETDVTGSTAAVTTVASGEAALSFVITCER